MMGKLFNKKTAKIYIAMICVSLVIAIVSSGFCISYSSELKKLAEESASSKSALSDIGSALISLLGGDDKAATENLEGVVSSLLTGGKEKNEVKVSEEEKVLSTKKTASLVLLIVFYVLTVAFFACSITSYEYEKYLESPKYKAKMKRLQKYEKIKNK